MVRSRHRHLVLEFVFVDGQVDQQINGYIITNRVLKAVEDTFGTFGAGKAKPRLRVIYWNSLTNLCILQVNREVTRYVLASITMNFKDLRSRALLPRCVHISGTIRSAKQAILKLARDHLIDARVVQDLANLQDEQTEED